MLTNSSAILQFIVFLNKLDLFTEKIKNTNHHLRLFFPQYNGPDHDVSAAKEFIKEKFIAGNMNKTRAIHVHFTTAVDTKNIKVIFEVVLDVATQDNFKNANVF